MTTPSITDHLPIALRAYAVPADTVSKTAGSKRKRSARASNWSIIFDTETTADASQALRFGTYQVRKAGDLREAGIFYDPDGVSETELALLRRYSHRQGLKLLTRDQFADYIFLGIGWKFRATIIGFNLPFDISRIAIAHNSARTEMRGGFTFRLSKYRGYPNVQVKHLSARAAFIRFAAAPGQPLSRSERKRGDKRPSRTGHFVDIKTLAAALFARSFSLDALGKFLGIQNQKLEIEDFAAPIDEDMVRYAVRDTQATWECYIALADRLGKLGLPDLPPEKAFSEASVGKGYIRAMGIRPWRSLQPDFPPQMIANILSSYFGGRSEVRIRREIRQVMLCDFLSMYPTVCTLMGLWRFVIADGMTWCDATGDVRVMLEDIDLAQLQSPSAWTDLRTIVRVVPDGEIFPVRAAYAGEAQITIGANHLTSDVPLWFTLADCIAAKLLTGKAPNVVEAIRFKPGSVQQGLQPIDISGKAEYRVDPTETDFFKRVIELRQSIKDWRDGATGDERAALDIEQNALKIAANATSYGIYIEVNVDKQPSPQPVTVWSSTQDPFTTVTRNIERPGPFFHPLLATLITGAARLMLAITERLVADRGLEWAFCDTDSMAIAKPVAMDDAMLRKRVREIVEWFAALNPYKFGGSILKIEDVNQSLDSGEPETLFCLAISSKRYALFNLDAQGRPILRKVSAHGLGHLLPPYSVKDAPADLPIPHDSVMGRGIERWHCDLWHHIIAASLAGHPDRVRRDYHPALSRPAISRYSATTPELLRWFKPFNATRPYRQQVRPFGFLLSMTEGFATDDGQATAARSRGRPKKKKPIKPTAPFDRDHRKAVALAFDRESGAPILASVLKTYADALERYHIQPESKFLNADYLDIGPTTRRHVLNGDIRHIGKEAHDWERQAVHGFDRDSDISYGFSERRFE